MKAGTGALWRHACVPVNQEERMPLGGGPDAPAAGSAGHAAAALPSKGLRRRARGNGMPLLVTTRRFMSKKDECCKTVVKINRCLSPDGDDKWLVVVSVSLFVCLGSPCLFGVFAVLWVSCGVCCPWLLVSIPNLTKTLCFSYEIGMPQYQNRIKNTEIY